MARKRKHSEDSAESCKSAGKTWVRSVKRTPHCRKNRKIAATMARSVEADKNLPVMAAKTVTLARVAEADKNLPVMAAKVVTMAREVQKDTSLPMVAAKVLYKDGKKVEKEKRKIDKIIKLSKKVNQRLNSKSKVFRPLKGLIQKKPKLKKIIYEVKAISTALAKRPANKDIGKLANLLKVKKNEPILEKPVIVPEMVNVIVPRKKPKA